ncbi:MAG: hypothetical protein JRH20_03195 [Deltaproteobacteria bacterium]|nr:hypothetical protein [Deltaproteobacteria bacterium]
MTTALKLWLFLLLVSSLQLASLARAESSDPLEPVKGLSPKVLAQVRTLVARYHAQQRKLMSLPNSATLIKLPHELKKLCRAADLVLLTFSEDASLSQAAFTPLRQEQNGQLRRKDLQRLLRHITLPDPKATWKALWAAGVLGPNTKHGHGMLIKLLETPSPAFARVHAAGALAKKKIGKPATIWQRAVQVLLKALGNADDTARLAHNYLPRFEPWMTRWLITRLLKADLRSPYWSHGMSRLAHCNTKSLQKPLRALFLRALKHPRVQVRIHALVGLRDQGLRQDDLKVLRKITRDKDENVRRVFYAALNKEGPSSRGPLASSSQRRGPRPPLMIWTAPLLLRGLRDNSLDAVAESAQSLMSLGYRPAVPKLVAFLKRYLRNPKNSKTNMHNAFRVSAMAVVTLAHLKGYDFNRSYRRVGNRHQHATVIVNRDAHYQREAQRLFTWWKIRGKKMRWR